MEQDFVGTKRWIRQASPYEVYMEEQNLPIHRGTVGFHDIRDLTLASWKRMGARGAFIELNGCGGLQGMYVIEVPGAGAITPEKHMYEEIFYVLEGRGTTEIWSGDDANKKQTFEWQPGSLFSPPLNTWHRIVNATSSPALLLGVTTAPPIFHHVPESGRAVQQPVPVQGSLRRQCKLFQSAYRARQRSAPRPRAQLRQYYSGRGPRGVAARWPARRGSPNFLLEPVRK